MSQIEEIFEVVMKESQELMESNRDISPQEQVQSYAKLKKCAQAATEHRAVVDPRYRVKLAQKMDEILNYLVDHGNLSIRLQSRVYTPAIQGGRTWKNVELLKDKCLAGYLLAEHIGSKPVMFFASASEDYKYLEYLPNLELLGDEESEINEERYHEFLLENYKKMDILVLHGMYSTTMTFLDAYRRLRPEGKVYCGLDMNRHWMKNIVWDSPEVEKFASQCNMISTSCTTMRDLLNSMKNVPFYCHYISHGFYNSSQAQIVAKASEKEDIILTVGRIGSKEKNNYELLLGFMKIAEKIPTWKLKFVGAVEEEFSNTVKNIYKKIPELKERIILTGAIVDKQKLFTEYAKAKIFALNSVVEGGTPNSYAEAVVHGCMFITSDVDGANDMTANKTLGKIYKSGDFDGFVEELLNLTKSAYGENLEQHIEKTIDYGTRYFDWERNAKLISHGLFL